MLPDSDDPARFAVGSNFLTETGADLVIAAVRPYRDKGLIVRFEGVRRRWQAETLRGRLLTVGFVDRRDLDVGEFWPDELAGLEAVTPEGTVLGTVDRLEFGPAQNRLVVVTAAGAEVQVPFVSALVGDPVDGRIVIDAPEGLF